MKRKFRLISTLFSIALAFSLLTMGVYAAATRTVGVTGNISFTSSGVAATVLVESALGSENYSQATGGTHTFTLGSGQSGKDIDLGTADLTDTTTTYKYRVTITSTLGGANSIEIAFSNTASALPTGLALAATKKVGTGTATNITGTTDSATITAGQAIVYEFVYTVTPINTSNFSATEYIKTSFVLSRV